MRNSIAALQRITPIVLLFLLSLSHPSLALQYFRPNALSPLIYDDPATLITPSALFVQPDGGFRIIDAGSNSSRLKEYSPDGIFVKGEIPSYSTDNHPILPSPGFNPFGPLSWSEGAGKLFILETRESGQTLKVAQDSSGWDIELPGGNSLHLLSDPSESVLFSDFGLADSEGEVTLFLNLEGYDKVTTDREGNIYALSIEGLGKFNKYAIPQWNNYFRAKPEGQFLPISIAVAADDVVVTGVLLPPGMDAYQFRSQYESVLSANPSLPAEEIRHLLESLLRSGTPILLGFSARTGKAQPGLVLSGMPVSLDTNAFGDVFVLLYGRQKAVVSRIAPGLSEELPLFELPLGNKTLQGTSRIAVGGNLIYFDRTEISYDENGEYHEKLTIERYKSDGKGMPEKFADYPVYQGGYLVAGLAANPNGGIYCAGSKFAFSPDGKIIPGGAFLDSYDSAGNRLLDFLTGSEGTLIPNALAMTPEGDIILAIAYETQSLSKPWAMRFSADGHLLKEFSYLGNAGISEINMVAGGTIAIAPDGLIYQCDNIRPPDPDEPYMRLFDRDGNHSADLTKFSLINSGLVGMAAGDAVLSWQQHYLLRIRSEVIISQVDLGTHFYDADILGVSSADALMYILASDSVIYTLPIKDGWDNRNYPSDEIDIAAEGLRSIVMDYITAYGSPPDRLDYRFLDDNKKEADLDGLLEDFYGPGPFDYRNPGKGEFSFLLLGRDPFQTLLRVTRTGIKPVL